MNPVFSDIYPLDECYAARGMALPEIRAVGAAELPDPYQALLAHEGDMTSRLENYHQGRIHIHLLGRRTTENEYFREVTLLLQKDGTPVEYGAIKIMTELFPEEARREIFEEKQPLGKILTRHGVAFQSQPRTFLRLRADDFINGALQLAGAPFLFGRRNTLLDPWSRPLAEIVEILPPCAPLPRPAGVPSSRSASLQSSDSR